MHIPEYSQIVSPLYLVTRKKNDFHWSPEQQQAFAQIKQEIAHAVALGPVRTGPDVNNVLYSAARNNGLSWSLWQKMKRSRNKRCAEEAPPYNQPPAEETRYALFTDSSCLIVGMNRKWKAAIWSPTQQVAQATEGEGKRYVITGWLETYPVPHATWMVNTRVSINQASPAQSEHLHRVDGDKVPVVHMKGILGKTVWINPSSVKGKPIHGIVFAQGPGYTWWVLSWQGALQVDSPAQPEMLCLRVQDFAFVHYGQLPQNKRAAF
ncbi:hypothetical protein DUI87_07162 [Hirundo rustica rustica]|uniref:Reverse transcriptase/retrotransposon-derived protein RNase H-like domain-containing protein n=1 Tax=Hirundo rustica rustica TaxID=333673 RepID=A0A3M0KPI2_HIRRU|nr:hypothetical protein DUI87_07162 [Hirundo rustica rustica]